MARKAILLPLFLSLSDTSTHLPIQYTFNTFLDICCHISVTAEYGLTFNATVGDKTVLK